MQSAMDTGLLVISDERLAAVQAALDKTAQGSGPQPADKPASK